MVREIISQAALGATVALAASAWVPSAQAEDFFSALFGGFGRGPSHAAIPLPFASEDVPAAPRERGRARVITYGGQAFCVRTCDGRYFPVNGSDNQSRAASCNSFCPASDTNVFYGSNIDDAATEGGKPYSELPNAFRYRDEIVAGCTCNGKDQIGLAPVRIEDDPTVRKGDLVAGPHGLMVAGRSADKRGASLNFTPASKSVLSRFRHVPVVARE
jgi:uncharacterized protein DUF2865